EGRGGGAGPAAAERRGTSWPVGRGQRTRLGKRRRRLPRDPGHAGRYPSPSARTGERGRRRPRGRGGRRRGPGVPRPGGSELVGGGGDEVGRGHGGPPARGRPHTHKGAGARA